MARRLYRLKSFEAIEARYQEQVRELQAKGEATSAELGKLRQERDQAKAAAEKAAEELARVKPEEVSELYQRAMGLFLAGQVDDALQVLDDEKLRQAAEAAARQSRQVVENYLLKARILTTQFKFNEAEGAYEKAIRAFPESFQASFGLGVFCQELNRYGRALGAYERARALAGLSGEEADVASTLNNLGNLHRDQNRMAEARQAFEEALGIRRKLAEANPETYLPDVASTLNNLGLLHRDENRMAEARQAFEEALKIYRAFAEKNPERYQGDVARMERLLKELKKEPTSAR
jgi:tetratricopeptide (TPR) repeat protein